MNCPLLQEQTAHVLLDATAGRLDPAQAVQLEAHVQRCVRCARFRAGQEELWEALDAWEPEPVSMGFNRELWRKIDQAAAEPWHRKWSAALRFAVWKPLFPVVAAALLIAAGFLLDHRHPLSDSQTVAGSPAVSVTEADQVEKTLDDLQLLRQFEVASAETSHRPM